MNRAIPLGFAAAVICILPVRALAQTPTPAPSAPTKPVQDTRLVPIHSQICNKGGIVIKYKLFVQMAENANPAPSLGLVGAVNFRKIVTSSNVCATTKTCAPDDDKAVKNLKQNYDIFLSSSQPFYRASKPDLSVEEYFQGDDDVNPILCNDSIEPPPPPPSASSLVDAASPIRIRGVSDDLWVSRQDKALFAKSSSATVNYTENYVAPQTLTTSVVGAIGYDLLPDQSTLGAFVPYVSGNISITDTPPKPRVLGANNFVAGGVLYSRYFYIPNSDIENQITLKVQQVDGTTMHSELTSLQAIYAPWTNPVGLFPALNSVVGFPTPDGTVPNYFGQVIFNLRSDLGDYENRGLPQYIAQNKSYERFGSQIGYAFIGNPPGLPSFSLAVTETALYGANGGPRDLSYFDALLQIYFDPQKLFSASLEYTNGRDENTYVITHDYKAGLSAHF